MQDQLNSFSQDLHFGHPHKNLDNACVNYPTVNEVRIKASVQLRFKKDVLYIQRYLAKILSIFHPYTFWLIYLD